MGRGLQTWTRFDPFNPSKNTKRLSAYRRRWVDALPVAASTTTGVAIQAMQWVSLCTPAGLPLTTDYYPSEDNLLKHYQVRRRSARGRPAAVVGAPTWARLPPVGTRRARTLWGGGEGRAAQEFNRTIIAYSDSLFYHSTFEVRHLHGRASSLGAVGAHCDYFEGALGRRTRNGLARTARTAPATSVTGCDTSFTKRCCCSG